jgi:hypothetical protein
MPRMPFLVVLVAASVLVPLRAGAQSPGPSYAPMELTADDLGTWDVEMSAHMPNGRPVTVRGVETNTVGCDGRCIKTKVSGDLKTATARSGSSAAWWRDYDGPAGSDLLHTQTGLRDTPATSSSQVARDPVPQASQHGARTVQRTNGSQVVRISVEYPAPDQRIVTTYRLSPDGQQVQTARIVYTRRQ